MKKTFILFILFSLYLPANAQTFPTGFSQVKVASLSDLTAMAFAPDGRLFICQKSGTIRIIKNGTVLPTPFITLTVDQNGERGISGITFDPAFNTNHYIYIYYTTSSPTIHNRLSRFTANGDVVLSGSEFPLLDLETVVNTIHNGGGIGFGPDGKLYLSTGEDNTPSNSQSLSTYKGKLLRINKDGSAPADNPFSSSSSPVTKRIWCYGLRNPYTLSFQPGTGKLFVNDVGADSWEEINDATVGGKNFGWPNAEGSTSNITYTNPVFAYPHTSTTQQHGCAVTGGTFFNPSVTNYPPSYFGKYFFMDFCNGWMEFLTLGSPVTHTPFSSSMTTQNLDVMVGPDGNLYYINRYSTNAGIYKIIYSNNNAPVITSQPSSISVIQGQPASFSVSVTGAAPLSYQWRKNGINISGATSATYTINSTAKADSGLYSVRITNSYGTATSNNATLKVLDYDAPPDGNIISPATGTHYHAGDTIHFSGSATDPEDGTLAPGAFTWTVEFWHNNNHFHPGPVIPSGITSGSFVIPNTGEPSAVVFYRLKLKVTDSKGLTDTLHVDILPLTSTITINTQPSGLQVTFDSQPKPTTFSTLTVEGLKIPIGAVSPQSLNGKNYAFNYWVQGGSSTHTIKVGTGDSTYTAVYKDTILPCPSNGSILREYWANVTGESVSNIPLTTAPTSATYPTIFEAPANVADNYGARMRGYVCVPQSGNYTFWVASDNNSELWLSTNDDPLNKRKIASVTGWTNSREWTKYTTQQSNPVTLNAGSKYYIEALHKEGTGGDHLAVGWQLPNGVLERPIPGSRLSPVTSTTSCGKPAGLFSSNVASTSATLNWTAVPGASSYNIQYRPSGTSAWLLRTASTNTFNLSGLTASTGYEWQLRSNCSSSASTFTALSYFTTLGGSSTYLVNAGSSWKYLDNGTNQGTAWRSASFSDAAWKTGNAELGYGDGGEATIVSYGPNSSNKYITTYFRKTFSVINKSSISGLELSLIRDDGVVVYINGIEVFRNNLPSGTISYNTLAPTYIDGANESTYIVTNISSSSLINGINLIAVEIHQNAPTSSDISFNLKLRTLSGARIADTANVVLMEEQRETETHYPIVSPNPTTGAFSLEFCFDNVKEEAIKVEIFNSLGQAVYTKQPGVVNGCIRESIELDKDLSPGIYIMKVIFGDKAESTKILLSK